MQDDDRVIGQRMRARAEAQTRARKRLRENHPEEWAGLYAAAVREVFAERGLSEP